MTAAAVVVVLMVPRAVVVGVPSGAAPQEQAHSSHILIFQARH